MDAIYFVEICLFLYVVLRLLGFDIIDSCLSILMRCLSGGVFICFLNFLLYGLGQNFFVRINEISLIISAVFGINGLIFLTVFQYIITK